MALTEALSQKPKSVATVYYGVEHRELLVHPLFRCLLGRDVLSRWIFTYDGPAGTWQISEASVSSWVEPHGGSDLTAWGKSASAR